MKTAQLAFLIPLIVWMVTPSDAQTSGEISTVAGNGSTGFSGDGVAATTTSLGFPWGVAVDSKGNLYIADSANNRIRKVSTNGIISTVAGGGTTLGDGGPATAASLNSPEGALVDAAGNLYIADTNDHRIRMVNPSGIITTIAGTGNFGFSGDGGPATAANLYGPSAIGLDAKGNIYFADAGNLRIRMINISGVIITVAGNGHGGFAGDGGLATAAPMGPRGVAVDAAGNFFIVDEDNNRIRKVNTSGIIETVAGNGTAAFSGDGGLATSASLYLPIGVGLDLQGNIYVADNYNQRVRVVNTSGIITTVAGNGHGGFTGDGGLATAASLSGPTDVAVDSAGNIFIADMNNKRIREVYGAAASGGGSDGPIPWWAFGALATSLVGITSCRLKRA